MTTSPKGGVAVAERRPRLVRYAQLAGVGAMALGAAVMLGWRLNVPRMTDVVAGWPTMKPVTAALCTLAGAALMLRAWVGAGAARRAAGAACAAAAGVLALGTLVERVSGVEVGLEVGVDRLLAGRSVGFPVPQTLAAFLLASAALLLIDRVTARGRSAAQILALVAGAIPFVALLGYTFGLPVLHSMGADVAAGGMAVHTAAALVLLTSGILAARPSVGLMAALTSEHAGGMVARRLLIGLLAFALASLLVVAGHAVGWYREVVVAALLVFLALGGGAALILLTAVRLNAYDLARRAAEALLRDSEQRFRELIAKAPDGIFTADLEGRYVDVNASGCRLLGLSREEIVGKTIMDFIPPEDVPRLWQEKDSLLGGRMMISEWKLRRRDGAYVPVEVAASILPDGRWQGFVRDVSERKRAEAALDEVRETDRQLRVELEQVTLAAMGLPDADAELPGPDLSRILRTIAQQAQALTGAEYVAVGLGTDPERPFDPWLALGVPQEVMDQIGHGPRLVGTLGVVATGGATLRVADVTRHPDFHGFPPHHPDMVRLLGVPIRYRGRSLGNLFLAKRRDAAEFTPQDQRMVELLAARAAVAIETTRLYAGEATQRAWLRNIIDQMPEGVILLDRTGHVVAANRAVLTLAHDDVGGRDPWGNPAIFDVCRVDGSALPFHELPAVRALERGETVAAQELAVRARDGHVVPILANAAPVRDDEGHITGATAVVQDITPLKELERLREEWASVIAHDLRQPVNAIVLAADSLVRGRHGDVPERERKAVRRIQSNVGRLSRMIDDLLDASRIEARRLSVSPERVDLAALAETVADNLRSSIGGSTIRVVAQPGAWAAVDPDRIQQVLTNLITNAAKYGDPGSEIRVEVDSGGDDLDGEDRDDVIELAVTNRGPGISADEMPLLFSRFGRTREARQGGASGLGLGLYISKGLVEAHGGRMWVDSTPGQLTSFRFVLPRASREVFAPADPGSPSPPP